MTQDEFRLQCLVNEVAGAHAVGSLGVRLTWAELMALALRIQRNAVDAAVTAKAQEKAS